MTFKATGKVFDDLFLYEDAGEVGDGWTRGIPADDRRIVSPGSPATSGVEEETDAAEVEIHPYREEEAGVQIERLQRVRRQRDGGAVEAALGKVRAAAEAGTHVMPPVIDAVEAYATVGEVCATLEQVYGSYQEPVRF